MNVSYIIDVIVDILLLFVKLLAIIVVIFGPAVAFMTIGMYTFDIIGGIIGFVIGVAMAMAILITLGEEGFIL